MRSIQAVAQATCCVTASLFSGAASGLLPIGSGSTFPGGQLPMSGNHFRPALRKRRVLSHTDYTVYAVNAFAVRNVAQPDEEFGSFATQGEFPSLIPKGEIWISEKLAAREGVFFIANALTQLKRMADGA